MKTIIKFFAAAAIMGFSTSCYYSQPIVREAPKNNQTYEIHYLFEHEGCKVYRFYDDWAGAYVYFTNCQGDVTSIKNDSTKERVTNSVKITYDSYDEIQKNK